MLNLQMVEWCTQHGLLLTTAYQRGQPAVAKISADVLLEALIQVAQTAMLAKRQ